MNTEEGAGVERPLLEIEHLGVGFEVQGRRIEVLDDVCLSIAGDEVVALIGETGCGKSVTGSAVLRMLPGNARVTGTMRYDGEDLLAMGRKEFSALLGREVGVIPQSPSTSLDPLMAVGDQVAECVRDGRHRSEIVATVNRLFGRLGLPGGEAMYRRYPCELSGGMCQRVLIAMGMISRPRLMIVDEPTKAIDWAVRKEVVSILASMRAELGCSMLLITHDIAVARLLADRVAVMYSGEIVESGPAARVLEDPVHPYTRGLIASMPRNGFTVMPGFMPSFQDPPPGCRFAERCPLRRPSCSVSRPAEEPIGADRTVRCPVAAAELAPRRDGAMSC